MLEAQTLGVMVGAYLLGCLNSGYYLVRLRTGNDVRRYGSGNAGARNTGRVLGASGFLLAAVGDCLKGAGAVALALWLNLDLWGVLLALLAVVAGHIWPAQLRFRGGKGQATVLGGMLVFDLRLTLILLGLALLALVLVRRFTPSGLIAVALAPAVTWTVGRPQPVIITVTLLAVLILWAHRSNIRNIIRNETNASRGN